MNPNVNTNPNGNTASNTLQPYLVTARGIDKATIQFYVNAETLFKAAGEASLNSNVLEVTGIQLAVPKVPLRRPLSNWLAGVVINRNDF